VTRARDTWGAAALGAVAVAACVALAVVVGWLKRPPEQTLAERVGASDVAFEWDADVDEPTGDPITSFIEHEEVLDDGTLIVEGWMMVPGAPVTLVVESRQAIEDAVGFSFVRADLPTADGARAFSVAVDLEGPGPPDDRSPCIFASVDGELRPIPTPRCP
jgi:hypothetical protein